MSTLYSNDTIREMAEKIVREDVHYCASYAIGAFQTAVNNLSWSVQQDMGVDEDDLRAVTSQDDWSEPAVEWIGNADLEDLLTAALELEDFDADEIVVPLLRAAILGRVDNDMDALRDAAEDAGTDVVGLDSDDPQARDDSITEFRDWVNEHDNADKLLDVAEACGAVTDAVRDKLREAMIEHVESDEDEARLLCDAQRLDPYTLEAYEHWIVSRWLASKLSARGEMVGEVAGLTIWGRCTTGQGISLDYVILKIAEELVNLN